METATDQHDTHRVWALRAFAVLLCAASAFSYLSYMGQGIVVGDLLGLRGREADVAIAQRRAICWLAASVCCWGGASVAGALATPIYEDAPRLPRFIARLVLALMISLALVVLIGFSFSIITAPHR
jgi:hypothetical protein